VGNGLRQEGSPLARDGHDRARRVPDDLAGHQAQQQPGEPSAARADDQQAGILRRVDQFLDREAADRADLRQDRLAVAEPPFCLVRHLLGGLAQLIEHGRVSRADHLASSGKLGA